MFFFGYIFLRVWRKSGLVCANVYLSVVGKRGCRVYAYTLEVVGFLGVDSFYFVFIDRRLSFGLSLVFRFGLNDVGFVFLKFIFMVEFCIIFGV